MTPQRVVAIVGTLSPADRYDYEERAAILEYDSGLERADAERMALREVLDRTGAGERHLRQWELID